jgi:hypothetical protein
MHVFFPSRVVDNRISRYDSNVELIIQRIMTRLSSEIIEYKQKILHNDDPEQTKDIPFGTLYQYILKKNNYQDLISLFLHVDGISITNSTKLKLWMLSGSLVELPAQLRSRRWNMVVISIWVAYVEPSAQLWLNYALSKLQLIKETGMYAL